MAYVIGGNSYRAARPPGGGFCVPTRLIKNVSHKFMSEKANVSDELIPVWARILVVVFLISCVVFTTKLLISAFSGGESEPTPQVVQEQREISVTSQNVKLIGGKYRYFFNIKNNDSKPFAGDVNIDLINAEGDSIYDKTFSSSQAVASGLGTSVYFDINTGPTSVHGANGIKTFSYTVKVGGQTVKTGSGSISTSSQ